MRKPSPVVPPLAANDPEIIGSRSSPRSRSYWRLTHMLAYLGLSLFIAAVLYSIALFSANSLLAERSTPEPADIILVLGGDGITRAERAAALWQEQMAPLVLVSGAGDCEFVKANLVEAGVDAASILMECNSLSTWDNATFSRPILLRMNIERAILVTSWFHSKRAVKRFRSLMPTIQWVSIPAERTKSYWTLAGEVEGVQIFKEYIKIVAYDLRSSFPEVITPANGAAAKTSRLP